MRKFIVECDFSKEKHFLKWQSSTSTMLEIGWLPASNATSNWVRIARQNQDKVFVCINTFLEPNPKFSVAESNLKM